MTCRLRMVPCTSQFCSFLWNLVLSYYLNTNKVKYIKIYIFRNFTRNLFQSRSSNFWLKMYFWEIAKKMFFVLFVCFWGVLSQFHLWTKITKNFAKPFDTSIHVSVECFPTLWLIFHFWKFWHVLLNYFQFKKVVKSHFLSQLHFTTHIWSILNQQNVAGSTFSPTLIICALFISLFVLFSIICFEFLRTPMEGLFRAFLGYPWNLGFFFSMICVL